MSFTRDDWITQLDQRNRSRIERQRADLSRFAQAVVPMEKLTGEPAWDVFLQVAQARNEADEQVARSIEERILRSNLVNSEEILLLKIALSEARARIAARNEITAIPAEIVKTGRDAVDILKGLE